MLRFGWKLLLLHAFFLPVCLGCSCMYNSNTPCETIRGDTIFVGRVTNVTPITKGTRVSRYAMHFAVERSLAGQHGAEILVNTGAGNSDCGMRLEVGQRALIFASKIEDGTLETSICAGNALLSSTPDAGDRIVDHYEELIKAATIAGGIAQAEPVWYRENIRTSDIPEGMEGLTVRIASEDFTANVQTIATGHYEIHGLPDGKYSVQPIVPPGKDFDHGLASHPAALTAGHCADVRLLVQPSTRIHGQLVFPPGAAPRKLEVDIVPMRVTGEMAESAHASVFTDENNRFDFWPLPAGDYYVGINIANVPPEAAPFPATYYPGSATRENATVVHVALGEVQEVDLKLPAVSPTRPLQVIAVDGAGKPVNKTSVEIENLSDPAKSVNYVPVDLDPNGGATLNVYADFSYRLRAGAWSDARTHWCSKAVSIAAGHEAANVSFVLDQKTDSCE